MTPDKIDELLHKILAQVEGYIDGDWEAMRAIVAEWAAGQGQVLTPPTEAARKYIESIAALTLDAERYRWLRKRIAGTVVQRLCAGDQDWRPERMDQLIDGFIGPSEPPR